MKPVINDKKCGAGKDACKVIKVCPTEAISYIEVAEAILDREVNCVSPPKSSCGCSCDCGSDNSNTCGGSPYSRIVIDYDKCIDCGLCIDACCGNAIEMK
jgi:NAD-dependent dihydropyrimidine dehydrogenase PreA subunit